MIVHDFSNKKLKKLYLDFNFKSHFIRNKSDLKLKTLFLICGTLLYLVIKQEICQHHCNDTLGAAISSPERVRCATSLFIRLRDQRMT